MNRVNTKKYNLSYQAAVMLRFFNEEEMDAFHQKYSEYSKCTSVYKPIPQKWKEQAATIKELKKKGLSMKAIAKEMGVMERILAYRLSKVAREEFLKN